MDISVVVPLYNEEESLPELYAWIERVMHEHHFTYEVIFVNDGSTDHSWQVIEELSRKSKEVKGIKFRRNYGKSPALFCGFKKAEGDVIITMDADLQDSPDEIPELYRMITEDGYDLVSGWKQKRYDPLSKTIPTKLFNATARAVSGIHNLHDFKSERGYHPIRKGFHAICFLALQPVSRYQSPAGRGTKGAAVFTIQLHG
jgi:glycosyltransferase involved in cell wall biosynthesis